MASTEAGRFSAPSDERRSSFKGDDVGRLVDGSLRRLRLDRIDMLSLHDLRPAVLGGGYEAARRDLLGGTVGVVAGHRTPVPDAFWNELDAMHAVA